VLRNPENIIRLGRNITKIRTDKGISQLQLCYEANIERRVLQRLEYGEGGPTLDLLISIYKALNTTIEDLFEGVFE
jgi:transcriptional regulator with XRE-family HTH domain